MNWDSTPSPLGESVWEFPPSKNWPRNDDVGRGADLSPETLIHAYRHGVFPMVSGDEFDDQQATDLIWWSPQQRAVIPLDQLIVTRSMRRSARKFEVRVDTCFEIVMRGCASPNRDHGWITTEFIEAYVKLHELGYAHSFEVFDESGLLAGGLYGVRLDGLFAGESMFHLLRDASKVALMALVAKMKQSEMKMLDVQWMTPHLQSLGAVAVQREQYLQQLAVAVSQ